MNGDVAGSGVEGEVGVVSERWPFLYQVVSKKAEVPALGVDGGLIVDRAIFEVENQVIGDAAIG